MRILASAMGLGLVCAASVALATPTSALAVAGAAVLAALVISRLEWGLLWLVALIYLLPFAVVPLPLGGVRPTFLDTTLAALVGLWVLRLVGARRWPALAAPGWAVIALVGIATAALLFGLRYGLPPENARQFVKLVAATLFYVVARDLLANTATRRAFVAMLALAGGAAALIGTVIYALPARTAVAVLSALGPLGYPTGPGVLRYLPDGERLRAIGTAIDPNVFGAALMIALVTIAAQVLSPQPPLRRGVLITCGLLCGAGLVLSLSRGSWVGTYAGLWLLAIAGRRPPLAAGLIALPITALMLPGAERYAGHFVAGLRAADEATLLRLAEYRHALELIREHPWLGVGFGNPPDVDRFLGVSSVYLQIAEHMGLLGLAAYLLAVGCVFAYAIRRLKATPERWTTLGALGALVAALIAGLFDHHYFELRFPHVATLFWLIAALAVAASSAQRPPTIEDHTQAQGAVRTTVPTAVRVTTAPR